MSQTSFVRKLVAVIPSLTLFITGKGATEGDDKALKQTTCHVGLQESREDREHIQGEEKERLLRVGGYEAEH